MKRGSKAMFTILVVPAVGALLLGCPKKITKTDTAPQPKVSELVGVTRPTPPAAGESAGARPTTDKKTDEQRTVQLLASRGEDIPIKESPTIEFVDPAPEDIAILKPIYFDYNKSSIRPEFQPVLEGVSRWLAGKDASHLLVEGHCDERGTDEYNLALGERRALSVRRYLIALGVSSDHVHTISYGEEKPAEPGSGEAAWSRNRRAEFKVSAQ